MVFEQIPEMFDYISNSPFLAVEDLVTHIGTGLLALEMITPNKKTLDKLIATPFVGFGWDLDYLTNLTHGILTHNPLFGVGFAATDHYIVDRQKNSNFIESTTTKLILFGHSMHIAYDSMVEPELRFGYCLTIGLALGYKIYDNYIRK